MGFLASYARNPLHSAGAQGQTDGPTRITRMEVSMAFREASHDTKASSSEVWFSKVLAGLAEKVEST